MAVSLSSQQERIGNRYASLQRFFTIDGEFRHAFNDCFEIFLSVVTVTNYSQVCRSFQVAGSLSEGASLARLFQMNEDFDSGLNQEIEFDIEFSGVEVILFNRRKSCFIRFYS